MNHRTRLYILDTDKLNHEACFHEYFHTLSPFRQKKIMSYYFPKDRLLSLGAGLLINRGLQEYGLQEANMHYTIGKNEKPVFASHPDIHFNISHSEQQVICAFSDQEQEQAFFRLWTLKESFMKITGRGMSVPLNSFRIYFDSNQIKIAQAINTQSYYFHEYSCVPGYKIAGCSHTDDFENKVISWQEASG